jgi:hypothetical protein
VHLGELPSKKAVQREDGGEKERSESLGPGRELAGQARKCTRWMPRHRSARKDVASCEKLRGAASGL